MKSEGVHSGSVFLFSAETGKNCSVSRSEMLCNSAHLLIKFVFDQQIFKQGYLESYNLNLKIAYQ